MGRSANTFAFVLVFVLLALVVYFIYQAATGTSVTTPDDQALLPHPHRHPQVLTRVPGVARQRQVLAVEAHVGRLNHRTIRT